MQNNLQLYNTLSREKEIFIPITPPHVGIYVCGPTVYGEPHLGHARPAITFDLLFRWLKHLGYKVRYVRNITDVGHLENDADMGEDKISKKARIEQLEPMEIAQHYTNLYREAMFQLNVLPPSIEPTASGHILEQISMIEKIINNGFAYESNGSVYFDVERYHQKHHYGKLSGRVIEDLIANTRELDGQNEKRSSLDFALWKKADDMHIMRWKSRWSDGFPGWHLECSSMSAKYLGETFDIHGGGMDLMFPHHECEIAQSVAAHGKDAVRYWLHNNMITINGQKMGKSLGNFITLNELFSGNHPALKQEYKPMVVRFYILQAHYRSTLDFSNEALQAAERGLSRLLEAKSIISTLKTSNQSDVQLDSIVDNCRNALNDDLNSPVLISHLFEMVNLINSVNDGKKTISENEKLLLIQVFDTYVDQILGLKVQVSTSSNEEILEGLVRIVQEQRLKAKAANDYATSDRLRDELKQAGIEIKDRKDGYDWKLIK